MDKKTSSSIGYTPVESPVVERVYVIYIGYSTSFENTTKGVYLYLLEDGVYNFDISPLINSKH